MNSTDRMELDVLRKGMWELFCKVARVPDHQKEIEIFIRVMDRHQEIISQDGREVAE